MTLCLIVTVDTEEEGLWGGRYRTQGNSVENLKGLGVFQHLCDRFHIRPTYLITAPVVSNEYGVKVLRSLQESGRAEIGSHVHPWCNPPIRELRCPRESYLCNLPEALQRAKIEWLTIEIQRSIGRRPTSFRAGRYGLDVVGARILEELGYVVDSSVIPFFDYSAEGGPDFSNAPFKPYVISDYNLGTPGHNTGLLEVPVTVGYSRSGFRLANVIRRLASRPPFRQLRCVGALERLGIARRIKLSPEQSTSENMNRLVDRMIALGAPCAVMMFHSSSLVPGMSPYVPDERALEKLLLRMENLFNHVMNVRRCYSKTMTEFALSGSEGVAPSACGEGT